MKNLPVPVSYYFAAARYTVSMPGMKSGIIVILFLLSAFLSFGYSLREGPEKTVRVTRIYDGDTVGALVAGRFEKIRMIGIDAPEMDQGAWGRRSKKCIESLIAAEGATVFLEYDVERRDKYGRLLAYIRTKDGRLLNEELLRNGCVVLFTIPPNVRYAGRFRAAQKKAREQKAGVWHENGLREQPSEYRREHPRRYP